MGITNPDYYGYLNQSGAFTVDGIDDTKEFRDTMVNAVKVLKIGTPKIVTFTILKIEQFGFSMQQCI